MIRNMMRRLRASILLIGGLGAMALAQAQSDAPALVRQVTADVITTARADAAIRQGDRQRIVALVEAKVMPHVDFERITRSSVGPKWREASMDQRARLQAEFKLILIRVYAGALSQVRDQTVEVLKTVQVPDATQVVVQTEVRGGDTPIKLDYRLDRSASAPSWKIIDLAVGGLWLVQSYRAQFADELNKRGVDGLITVLAARNAAAGQR